MKAWQEPAGIRASATAVAVRKASIFDEREELIAVLERHFPDLDVRSHFIWRHDGNPAGPGSAWLLYDCESGETVGTTSMFPRQMYLDGKLVMCGQVSQFAIDKAYRSLGPAVMLQRATFEAVDSGRLVVCYDCPVHEEGMSTFLRLGMRPSCKLNRYVFLIRIDEVMQKRFGSTSWAKPLVFGANFLLEMRRGKQGDQALEITTLNGRFGEEFTHLDKLVSSVGILRGSRSAEVLNWRYRERPDAEVDVLVARERGEVLAFLALMVNPKQRASILDLFGRELNRAGRPLLGAAIQICRKKNVLCLEGHCSEASELRLLFEAAGFRAREVTARVVPYAKKGVLESVVRWPMGQADLLA